MSEKIDVLQAKINVEAESIRNRSELLDNCIYKAKPRKLFVNTALGRIEQEADGKVKAFGLDDELDPDIETKEKVSDAEIEQIAKDVIKNDVSDKSATPRRHRVNKSTK